MFFYYYFTFEFKLMHRLYFNFTFDFKLNETNIFEAKMTIKCNRLCTVVWSTRKILSNENKYTKTTPIEDAKSQLFSSFFLPKYSSRSLKAIPAAAAASFEMDTLRANKFGFEKTSNGTKVNGSLK